MPATSELVDQVMKSQIPNFARNFKKRYASNGSGLKNLIYKANNPFISVLGEEIIVYSTLMRSLDSSLGNCLENIARSIAEASYEVHRKVEGDVPLEVDKQINNLMNEYLQKRIPKASDLVKITSFDTISGQVEHKIHKSDYHLIKRADPRQHFLLELKIGGDLDNKKARSEKQALLEQYAILRYSSQVKDDSVIRLFFATAYNKFGEDEAWKQERVKQFFGEDELLIGRDFWNFICDTNEGNQMVINSYKKYAHFIKDALDRHNPSCSANLSPINGQLVLGRPLNSWLSSSVLHFYHSYLEN